MFSLLLFRPYLPRSQASVFGSRGAMGRMAWGRLRRIALCISNLILFQGLDHGSYNILTSIRKDFVHWSEVRFIEVTFALR